MKDSLRSSSQYIKTASKPFPVITEYLIEKNMNLGLILNKKFIEILEGATQEQREPKDDYESIECLTAKGVEELCEKESERLADIQLRSEYPNSTQTETTESAPPPLKKAKKDMSTM